jgi:hypothetical protein
VRRIEDIAGIRQLEWSDVDFNNRP